jgi:hypothetical protein
MRIQHGAAAPGRLLPPSRDDCAPKLGVRSGGEQGIACEPSRGQEL